MPLKYTTVEELKDVLTVKQQRDLSDDVTVGPLATPTLDEELIERYLGYAESTVDSIIQTRYALPLAEVPLSLVYAVLVIAKYRLLMRRGIGDDDTQREYDNATGWLRRVQEEDADLFESASSGVGETTFGVSINEFFDGQFFL